jgi:uncharacterized membrane protein YfcA
MVMLVSVVCTLVIAFFSGAVGSLLGLGGGVIMVPLLIFLLDVPLHIASGASIIAVVATSTVAAGTYVREELTNIRLGMFLEFATTLGAVTGALLTSVTDDSVLRIVFGLSLLYATVTMYLQLRNSGGRSWRKKPDDWLAGWLRLGSRYHDAARDDDITYGVSRTPLTFAISYIAGIVSGLLGIGGGGIKVPAMNVGSSVPMKAAVATSNFMIGVTAAASAIVYIRNQYCNAFITAPVVLGTLTGAYVGSRLTHRVKGVLLKQLFVVVLTVLAARMILSGMGV